MTMQTIRKNSTKKIQAYLDQAAGIIFYGKERLSIEDSYDESHKVVNAEAVLNWLSNPKNYAEAVVLLDGDELRVGGKYWFEDSFTVFFNKSKFDEALAFADRVDGKALEVEAEKENPKSLPTNVVSLCAYRQSLVG